VRGFGLCGVSAELFDFELDDTAVSPNLRP